MVLLMISAAVLVLTVALAACTHEGSWLVYFESLAGVSPAQTETADQVGAVTRNASSQTSPKKERIIPVPSIGIAHAKVAHS